MTNRVVITGYGITSPIGNTPEEFWANLEAGNSGIDTIKKFDATATGISVAGEVKDFEFADVKQRIIMEGIQKGNAIALKGGR